MDAELVDTSKIIAHPVCITGNVTVNKSWWMHTMNSMVDHTVA